MKRVFAYITVYMTALTTAFPMSSNIEFAIPPDSIATADSSVCTKNGNIITRFLDYIDDSNKPPTSKAFDISVLGGPYYTSDKGFGLGLIAAGLYKTEKTDSLLQPSSVSVYANATTSLFFDIGIEGNTIFPKDKYHLSYNIGFQSFDTYYWGIGYDMASDNSNKSKYKYFKIDVSITLGCKVLPHFYIGPVFDVKCINRRNDNRPDLWNGLPQNTFNYGGGIAISYDSRDFIPNPYSGIYASLTQEFYPKCIFNKYPFTLTQINLSAYKWAWKGGVIAAMLQSRLTYGDVPWGLLSTFGGSFLMRGYFEGQYRDKCMAVACVEIRQHIMGRSSAVAWGGAGNVFPSLKRFDLSHTLPNYGVGYRWEFKNRVNVRLDLGFGKSTWGVVFSINEAF